MLDERSLRRHEFAAESEPVTLADGQTWHFPKPWVVLSPVVVDGKVQSTNARTSFGPEFDALMDAVDAEPNFMNIFGVAVNLLARNYNLADGDYSELLRFRKDNEDSLAMIQGIMDVARGLGPKHSAAGVASPS